MVRSSVDLPTPFRPSTARLPCCDSVSDTPSSTTAEPYPARTSSSVSSGSAMMRARSAHRHFVEGLASINRADARLTWAWLRSARDQHAPADHDDDPCGKAENQLHVVLD